MGQGRHPAPRASRTLRASAPQQLAPEPKSLEHIPGALDPISCPFGGGPRALDQLSGHRGRPPRCRYEVIPIYRLPHTASTCIPNAEKSTS